MTNADAKVVHVVHGIDTEGPLKEPLEATFHRLSHIFNIELEPTEENLRKIQNMELDLGGLEQDVAKVFAPALISYNDDWDKVHAMLARIMTWEFRERFPDSYGEPWKYTWFTLDHVGFEDNPRFRDLGWHKVYDRYRAAQREFSCDIDEIGFHHHPVPFSRAANHCATAFFNHTPIIFEILARKILERGWFPASYRPGFHTIRPDSHWFLEQYIPFDYSNQSSNDDYSAQTDLSGGRYGDWRRAPQSWTPYHPSHDDYQVPGGCRRWIARCLNVGTRFRLMEKGDVEKAFDQAQEGAPTILSFTHHDYRDMEPDIDYVQSLIREVAEAYPDVKFRWCTAREAMRSAMNLPEPEAMRGSQTIEDNRLVVSIDRPIFGPQPFLAIKTKDGRFLSDNFDFQSTPGDPAGGTWTYVFDEQTQVLDDLEAVGWAANDAYGNTIIGRIDLLTNEQSIL